MRLIRYVIASLLLGALSACGAATVIGPTATPALPTATPAPLEMTGRIAYVTRDRTAIRSIMTMPRNVVECITTSPFEVRRK